MKPLISIKQVLNNSEVYFFFFAVLLPSLIDKRSCNTLSVFEEGVVQHIWRAKGWLYGFESVFGQVLYDFLFVVYLLFFFNRIRNSIPTVPNSLL